MKSSACPSRGPQPAVNGQRTALRINRPRKLAILFGLAAAYVVSVGVHAASGLPRAYQVDPEKFVRSLEHSLGLSLRPTRGQGPVASIRSDKVPVLGELLENRRSGTNGPRIQDRVRLYFSTATRINFGGLTLDVLSPDGSEPGRKMAGNFETNPVMRPLFFLERSGLLYVRASASELKKVEEALRTANGEAVSVDVPFFLRECYLTGQYDLGEQAARDALSSNPGDSGVQYYLNLIEEVRWVQQHPRPMIWIQTIPPQPIR